MTGCSHGQSLRNRASYTPYLKQLKSTDCSKQSDYNDYSGRQ